MQNRFFRQTALLAALFMVIGSCLVDAGAQTRKKRRSRRSPRPVITNPVITPPAGQQNGEEKIISTADDSSGVTEQLANSQKRLPANPQEMQATINALSNQVTKLTEKLSQMQDDQRSLLDMERLTRAEQRAETFRAQLRDVETKEAELQTKLEEIEYAQRPENVDRVVSLYGTTHPEEARDSRRRQLENDKTRTQTQLNTLSTSRVRLESAILTADREVDLLRERLDKLNPVPSQSSVTTDASPPPSEPPPAKNPYPPQ